MCLLLGINGEDHSFSSWVFLLQTSTVQDVHWGRIKCVRPQEIVPGLVFLSETFCFLAAPTRLQSPTPGSTQINSANILKHIISKRSPWVWSSFGLLWSMDHLLWVLACKVILSLPSQSLKGDRSKEEMYVTTGSMTISYQKAEKATLGIKQHVLLFVSLLVLPFQIHINLSDCGPSPNPRCLPGPLSLVRQPGLLVLIP